jgi:hypothetical protein
VRQVASIGLLVLGLLQMAGDIFHLPLVKGFALATAASPAPKVFSAVRGLETYSTHFYLEWTDIRGSFHSREITPEMNSHLRGPYNRRNVFGAVLAYGPVLVSDSRSRPMFDAVASYALCGQAPLLGELGVDSATVLGQVTIRLVPRPDSHLEDLPLTLEAPCR